MVIWISCLPVVSFLNLLEEIANTLLSFEAWVRSSRREKGPEIFLMFTVDTWFTVLGKTLKASIVQGSMLPWAIAVANDGRISLMTVKDKKWHTFHCRSIRYSNLKHCTILQKVRKCWSFSKREGKVQVTKGYGPKKSSSSSKNCNSSSGMGFKCLIRFKLTSYLVKNRRKVDHLCQLTEQRQNYIEKLLCQLLDSHSSVMENCNCFSKWFCVIFRHLISFLKL